FQVLGIKPQLGRTFTPEDDRWGAVPTLVLSDSIWRNTFGADPAIVGQPVTLDGKSFTVIGVLQPPGFEYLYPQGAFAPIEALMTPGSALLDRGNHGSLRAIARLNAGATREQAQEEMRVIAAQLEREYPATNSGNTCLVTGLHERMVRGARTLLLVLMGAVAFVLLMACANLANLLLARDARRGHEIGVRLAIGARRSRITRQLLTESILLAILGGGAGVLAGNWFLRVLLGLAPQDIPRLAGVHLDRSVLVFTIGLSLLCGLLF